MGDKIINSVMRMFCKIVNLFGSREDKEKEVLCKCETCVWENVVFFGNAPLTGGSHTAFSVGKCRKCGGVSGFPEYNFLLAVQQGTEETLQSLREIGIDVEVIRIALVGNLAQLNEDVY